MVLTVFRSRLREDLGEDGEAKYVAEATALVERAKTFPGFIDVRTYGSPSGERVTLVWFEDEATQRVWAEDPKHQTAQTRGREMYYSWFHIGVYSDVRAYDWTLEPPPE